MPRLLELFAGTGSVGRAFKKLGWEVVSVDIDPKTGASHVVDILLWNYGLYARGYYDFVWASPVCQHYSVARTTGPPRDLHAPDRLVQRALDLINYFGCNWAMENPQSGLLKGRDIVKGLPYVDTSYCKFGYVYRKNTRIWTSLAICLHAPCSLKNPCSAMVGKRHPMTAQQSRRSCDPTDKANVCSQKQLYSIPELLCDEIAQAAQSANVRLMVNDAGDEGAPPPTPVRQI